MAQGNTSYDLIVIGGGSAGLTAAEAAAVLGVRVALIEAQQTGGECTWFGCIPSKSLLAAAKMAYSTHRSKEYGIHTGNVTVDFAAVMAYVKHTIHDIYDGETPDKLRERGVDVYTAYATFSDPHTLSLSSGETLRAKYILIATGAKYHIPAGFDDVPYLTNETLFDLTEQPQHLIIVGAGPIGTEMAQAFNRLGTTVTLISSQERILPRDEPEAAAMIQEVLMQEGVQIITNARAVGASGDIGAIQVQLQVGNGQTNTIEGTHLLLATGKRPDVRGLKPEAANIETRDGLLVLNKYLRTSQKHIFAAGDVANGPQFTHMAGPQAANALLNMLLPIPITGMKSFGYWATFTDPELAHAGLGEAEARQQYNDVHITQLPITRADRAMTEGYRTGFIKLVHRRNGKLLGATIVAHNAGEMMNHWVHILDSGGYVRDMALKSFIYPTLGSTNAIIATEQLRHQVASGHWLGRLVQWVAHRKL